MPKPISPSFHGVIDYLTVPLLLVAGPLLHFDGLPAQITSTLAGVVLVYSAATAYAPGIVKLIPLRTHRLFDMLLGAGLVVSPWALGFSGIGRACYFFVGLGVFVVVVVALTDFFPSSGP